AFLRGSRSLLLSDGYGRGGVWDVANLRQTTALDPWNLKVGGWLDAGYAPESRQLLSVLGDRLQNHHLLAGRLVRTVRVPRGAEEAGRSVAGWGHVRAGGLRARQGNRNVRPQDRQPPRLAERTHRHRVGPGLLPGRPVACLGE